MGGNKIRYRSLTAAVGLAALSSLAVQAQPTQTGKRAADAVKGLSQNQANPMQIEAATLEVHDKEKQKFATFEGDVHVVQGDTDMRCKTLFVYYDDAASARGEKRATRRAHPSRQSPAPPPRQQIKRLDAKGGIVISQKDQIATGDRLWVNWATGASRVESANTGRGIRAQFNPSSGCAGTGKPDREAVPDSTRPPPTGPRQPN